MRRTVVTAVVLALALPLAVASGAVARRQPVTLAPPGNSGVSQYLEVVPTDGGSKPTSTSGAAGGALNPRQRRGLDALGTAGRTLAAVVGETAPPPQGGDVHHRRVRAGIYAQTRAGAGSSGGGGRGSEHGASSPSSGTPPAASPVGSVFSAALGRGGLGYLLPAITAAVALVLVVQGVMRWRRGRPQ
jgi:hypothetical protein